MYENRKIGQKPGWRGRFVLQVSKFLPDWSSSNVVSKAQVENTAKLYIVFAKAWLVKRGYDPEIRLVDKYDQNLGGYDWQSEQRDMRMRILSDFLSPSNLNQPFPSGWKGIRPSEPNVGLPGLPSIMTKRSFGK